jgi:hypothetical protein
MNWVMPVQWLTYLWLGDHERGLCWWADSAEGWTLPKDKKTPVVEITRRNGVVTAVFHLLSRPATVLWKNAMPRKIEFAFAATPLKPRPTWARDIGLCNPAVTRQRGPRLAWFGSCAWALSGTDKYQGNPYTFAHLRPVNAACEAWLKKRMDQAHAQGQFGLAYTDMRSRSLIGEPEKAFVWEWAPSRTDLRKTTVEKAPFHAGYGVSSTQSRIDYDLWCLNRNMDLGMDFWYFDEIQNEGQVNPATGLGYRDEDGRWMPTMRMFQYRQLWKRLYTLMHERGQEEPVIVMHNTSTTYAGPMAFCTTTWDFEEGNNDPTARQLTKFGMDYLITEAMGHQYGFAASTLGPGGKFEGWLERHPEEKVSADRHWVGVHMLLDMNPYLTSAKAVEAGLKTLGEFGWNERDCRWIPFWEAAKQGLFTTSPAERVYASMYKRGAKTLLIILNDTNQDVTINWQPAAKLGVRGPLVDAEAPGTTIAPTGTAYPIPLSHFNYRAFLLETGGAE